MYVLDILSQERLTAADVYEDLVTNNNVPGMMTSSNNFEQITFGNYRLYMEQLSFTNPSGAATLVYLQADSMQFGSGDAVTVEKLWCYRFIMSPSIDEDASIKIWDYETGECEQTLREHTGMINYINFHPKEDKEH